MKQLIISLALFAKDQFITSGDGISQFLGRWIPCRIGGRWTHYTRTVNESISGASNWHSDNDRWPWVEKLINAPFSLLYIITFGLLGEHDHCLKARIADRSRAGELLQQDKPKREALL